MMTQRGAMISSARTHRSSWIAAIAACAAVFAASLGAVRHGARDTRGEL